MATVKIVSSQRTRLGSLQLMPQSPVAVEPDELRKLLAEDNGHGRTLMAAGVLRVLEDASTPAPAAPLDGAIADATREIEQLRARLGELEAEAGRASSAHRDELQALRDDLAASKQAHARELEEKAALIPRLEARVAELEKTPGAPPSSEVATLIALKAEELIAKVEALTDEKLLFSIYEAESQGKNRRTVLGAIEAREEALRKANG